MFLALAFKNMIQSAQSAYTIPLDNSQVIKTTCGHFEESFRNLAMKLSRELKTQGLQSLMVTRIDAKDGASGGCGQCFWDGSLATSVVKVVFFFSLLMFKYQTSDKPAMLSYQNYIPKKFIQFIRAAI